MWRFSVNRFAFMIISLALLAIGLLIIINSAAWGHEAANSYLRSQGGGMDTAQFMIILQENINAYRWLGSLVSLIGRLGFIKSIELK
jgi:hypothetical protein